MTNLIWTKFAQQQTEEIEHHHSILNILISLGVKFELKLIVLNFWTEFAQ